MKKRGIRTGLTILGVVIGVISVVSMLALGIGVKNELLSEAMMEGSVTDVTIYGASDGKRKDRMITDRRMEAILDVPHIESITPMLSVNANAKYNKYTGYLNLTGVPRTYLEGLKPKKGNLPEINGTRLELLMGGGELNMFINDNNGISYIEAKAPTKEEQEEMDRQDEELSENGIDNAGAKRWNDWSGEYVELTIGEGMFYYGNADEPDDYSGGTKVAKRTLISGMLSEYDYNTYCDLDTLKKILKRNARDGRIYGQPTDENGKSINEWVYTSALVKVDDVENVDTIVRRLSDMGYQAESNKEYVDEVQREIKIIRILLGGIGAIALVVAVIGIGNTMTTSVYDRIGEIGILKVLGCDPDEMMGLFLLESGILGGIGGVIGLLLSYVISDFGINRLGIKLLNLHRGTQLAVIPLWLAISSVVMAVVLGILAGYLPAKWTSKLRPIDAVRMKN